MSKTRGPSKASIPVKIFKSMWGMNARKPGTPPPQVVIEQWRVGYNTCRPRSALGYRPLGTPRPFSQPEAVM
jgi:transposase InsO family protein